MFILIPTDSLFYGFLIVGRPLSASVDGFLEPRRQCVVAKCRPRFHSHGQFSCVMIANLRRPFVKKIELSARKVC